MEIFLDDDEVAPKACRQVSSACRGRPREARRFNGYPSAGPLTATWSGGGDVDQVFASPGQRGSASLLTRSGKRRSTRGQQTPLINGGAASPAPLAPLGFILGPEAALFAVKGS